jgi:hypothetical protein
MPLSLEEDLRGKSSSVEVSGMLASYLPLEHILLDGGDQPREVGIDTTDTFCRHVYKAHSYPQPVLH